MVGHLLELRQLTQSSSFVGQTVAWLILGYSMLLTVAFLLSLGFVLLRFVYQVYSSPPTEASQIKGTSLSEDLQEKLQNFIGSNDIFSAMSDEQRTLLIEGTEYRKYKSNSIVYAKNQSSDMIYYIIDGTIEICDPLPEGAVLRASPH